MADTNQVHTEVGQSDHIEDGGGFPPFNSQYFGSQLLWLAICFGVLYVIMGRLAIPRISQILESRAGKISADLADAARLKEETDAAIATYEKALASARQNAAAIVAETRANLTADVEAKRHAAEADLREKLSTAEADIAAIKEKALAEVNGIALETAEAVISALSTASVSHEDVVAAVNAASLH